MHLTDAPLLLGEHEGQFPEECQEGHIEFVGKDNSDITVDHPQASEGHAVSKLTFSSVKFT